MAVHVEALEKRSLFSVVVNGTTLEVTGTSGPDVILVTSAAENSNVNLNGTVTPFNPAVLTAYTILGGDGHDLIIIYGKLSGVYVHGGVGNDRIAGGEGNETLYGGAGKDQIDGGLGNDKLNGNGGHDKLFGNAGGDRLYAGLGNDWLDGGSSSDRLFPDLGNDTCLGQSGNDIIRSSDGEVDEVYGGSGTDSGILDGIDVRASMEQVAII